jgi:hypothetical protein
MVLVPVAVKPVKLTGVGVAVHVKVAPVTFDVKDTSVVKLPEQTDWVIGVLVTSAVGFTVIVYVSVLPAHEFAVGMMVMVTVPGLFVELISVQEGIGLAVPDDAAPVIPEEETVVHE